MAPVTSDEFEGDDFSNNLFSDLAPLLTLFGEQVTKQFLSMSMGWADNVLLAMGPLGIITTIVSAIRVGGEKRLKALIGRARESDSVAEQELLSSTSQNVCEMCSGRQIVRLIGNGEDMETFVIARDGVVSNLRTAINGHRSNLHSSNWWAEHRILSQQNYPPNLTLNVQGAAASTMELWAWALLGTVFQLFSIAFSGMITYHLKWTKAGAQVAEYGYPCFCAGTTCLIIAILGCGHVIEGVTDEMTWLPSGKGSRILTLQKAHSVGDQHFPSCAIFMTRKGETLKFSRLNNKSYKLLVTISTSLALVGYIVQFVGLRALHWSATITQLGITLIMTAIRAWVRRGLASDPDCYPLIEGHELANLALILHNDPGAIPNVSRSQNHIEMTRKPLYELIFLCLLPSEAIYKSHQFHIPLQTSLNFQYSADHEEDTAPLRIYDQISMGSTLSSVDKEASTLLSMFFNVIRHVMGAIDVSGVLLWKGDASRLPSEQLVTDDISWVFDFGNFRRPDFNQTVRRKASFRLRRSTSHPEYRWTLLHHGLIAALLALSAHALGRRLEHLHRARGGDKLSIGDDLFFVDSQAPHHPSSSGRIVGNINNDDSLSNQEMLEEWLDTKVLPKDIFFRSKGLKCYLGIMLTPPPEDHPRPKDLVIETRRDSGLLLQWTQELFSIFMLAIASKVERVLGETKEVEGKRGPGKRCFKNSVFDTIADVVVRERLAHDRDEAYTLIVPAFAKYGLLPTCSTEQTAEHTSERATSPAQSNSEENTL